MAGYIMLPFKPTGMIFNYINNIGYITGLNTSIVRPVNLEAATAMQVQYTIASTTPLHSRPSGDLYSELCVYDPYRNKLLLVSTNSVQILNTQTGLLEYVETGLTIQTYNRTLYDFDRGYAYVIVNANTLRVYSLATNAMISSVSIPIGNVFWQTFDENKNVILVGAGENIAVYQYAVNTNSIARWGTITTQTAKNKTDILYIPEASAAFLVNNRNRVQYVTPTQISDIDNSITSNTPMIFQHTGLQRVIITTNTSIRIFNYQGTRLYSAELPQAITYAALDINHNILACLAGNTIYIYKISNDTLILRDTISTTADTYFGVYADRVFSRIYILEHSGYRVAVYDYAEQLKVYLEITRGASEWTGSQFNDSLTITVKSENDTPVMDAVCECSIYGNGKFNVNGVLADSTTVSTQSDGTANVIITVTGPGAYVVNVRASK